MNPKTIAFHHFGCKVNFAEASALSRQFKDKGYELADFRDKADIYVISTCVVTGVAEKKCRAAIRQAHKLNPDAKIAVIGCFPELKPGEISGMEGVSLVLGHQEKFSLLDRVESIHQEKSYESPMPCDGSFVPSWSSGDRTRSFLKIQDGCDYYCAYCAIPLARGHSRSDSISHVTTSTIEIAATGVKEIILTGVNIGDFGRHNNETLAELIEALEKSCPITRIRLSSIEPDLLSDDIIRMIASSGKFLPHFHIPLQSGSDRILNLMKRKYSTKLYATRVDAIRSRMPAACIAADVIVGFPGETEEDFADTQRFLEGLDLSYLHVFSYSKRENTLAARSPGAIPEKVKKERSEILHRLSEEKKKHFYRSNKGGTANVLFESDNSNGFMHGFTENYIRVKTKFNPRLINQVVKTRLEEMDRDGNYVISNYEL